MPNRQYQEVNYGTDNYGGNLKQQVRNDQLAAARRREMGLFIGAQKLGQRFARLVTATCHCSDTQRKNGPDVISTDGRKGSAAPGKPSPRDSARGPTSGRAPVSPRNLSGRGQSPLYRTGARRRAPKEPYKPPAKWENKSSALLSKCAKYTVKGAKARTRGNVALFNACSLGQEKLAKKALSPPNVPDVNDVNPLGFTPLMVACQNALLADTEEVRHGSIVKLLLEANSSLNMEDNEQRTPVHHALAGGGLAIVKLLVEKKADLRQRDKRGRSCVMLAALSDCISLTSWVLVKVGDVMKVKEDVIVAWRDDAEWTAVHHACQAGSENVLRFLVARGAQFQNFKGSRAAGMHHVTNSMELLQGGTPPILLAAMENHLEICAYLMRVRQDQLPAAGSEAALVVHADIKRWQEEMQNDPLIMSAIKHEGIILDLVEKGDKKSVEKLKQKIQELVNSAARRSDIEPEHFVCGEHIEVQKGITPLLAAVGSPTTGTSLVKTLIQARAALPGPRDDQGCNALLRCARNGAKASFRVLKVLLRELVQRQEKGEDMGLTSVDVDCCGILLCSVACEVEEVALDKTKFVLSTFSGETSSRMLWTKRDHYGCLALHIAARNGHAELMAYVGDKMLPTDWPPNEKGKAKSMWDCETWGGTSALLLAAENLHLEVCQELVARSADVSATDNSGLGFPNYVNRSGGSQQDQKKLLDWWSKANKDRSSVLAFIEGANPNKNPIRRSKTFMDRLRLAKGATQSLGMGVKRMGSGLGNLRKTVRAGVASKFGAVVKSIGILKTTASNSLGVNRFTHHEKARTDVPTPVEDSDDEDDVVPLLKFASTMSLDEQPDAKHKKRQTVLMWTCLLCKKQNMPNHAECAFCGKAKSQYDKIDGDLSAADILEVRAKNGDCVVYKLEAHPTEAGKKALFSYEDGELEGQVAKLKVHHATFSIEDIVKTPDGGKSPGELHLEASQKEILDKLVALAKRASDTRLIELGLSRNKKRSSPRRSDASPRRGDASPRRGSASPRERKEGRKNSASPQVRSENRKNSASPASPRQRSEGRKNSASPPKKP